MRRHALEPADLSRIRTYPLSERKSKVDRRAFARLPRKGRSFLDFYEGLPSILAVNSLRAVAGAIIEARRKKKPVLFLLGAHVLKVGLNPIVIDLMKKGIVTGVATNGAGIIHDFEIAFAGQTSEDVQAALEDGSFGMAQETAEYLNEAVAGGARRRWGLGESVGRMVGERRLSFRDLSLFYWASKLGLPATVHVAIGTDIIHQNPSFDAAATGQASYRDFKILIREVEGLGEGGVVVNFGSAVILPEVFLKAVSCARNLGASVRNFTAANFDMIQQYRPRENVVHRPTASGRWGYTVISHHEILMPLLAQAVVEGI